MAFNVDAALMAHQLMVQFVDVQEKYSTKYDIVCKFTLGKYVISNGDRIAIFATNWKNIRDYAVFEWLTEAKDGVNTITFSRYDLPRNKQQQSDELYQFCFINADNIIQGISRAFQIVQQDTAQERKVQVLKESMEKLAMKDILARKDEEINKLKQENFSLKEALQTMADHSKIPHLRNYEKDISDLKELTELLREAVVSQQKDIAELRTELRISKTEKKGLILDKIIAEKKFEVLGKTQLEHIPIHVPEITLDDLKPLPPFPSFIMTE